MSYAPTEWESYHKGWQQRRAQILAVLESRRAETLETAKRCAHILVEEYGARAVYGFGSLYEGRLHERSDLDLAVEGLSPARYFKAYARVCAECPDDIRVDLVPMESVSDTFRERIRTRGRRVDATTG